MDKVGVLVKLFLNVIRFFCENGKGAVKILQGILWRFQKELAVREAAEFAGRGKDPCIDQIRKYGMEIISKPVVVTDISADVVQPQFGAELLQEQVTNVKKTLFAQWNTGKRGKGDSNFFPALVVEQSLFNTEKYEMRSIYDRFDVAEMWRKNDKNCFLLPCVVQ